jgi:hypothetical protein
VISPIEQPAKFELVIDPETRAPSVSHPAVPPDPGRSGDRTTAIIPAPAHVLARAAWIRAVVIWHADRRFTRLGGAEYAAALAANGRLRSA